MKLNFKLCKLVKNNLITKLNIDFNSTFCLNLLKKNFSSHSSPLSSSSTIITVPNYHFTNNLNFSDKLVSHPIFRILDLNGKPFSNNYEVIDKPTAIKILSNMVRIKQFDDYFNMKQRNEDISFYMTCKGEEAAVTSSAAALKQEDSIYPQYREAAALLYRGFSTKEMTNQLVGNHLDNGKGRQMPVHYGSRKLNYQTVSSPLATQIPQAAGAGYLFKASKKDKVCITYFGEGAASEGDFHAGMNFAATLGAQTIFFCRNNKYAISTSFKDQYAGDGIASRGCGYGMMTVRIDGNDALGVYYAVQKARELVIAEKRPVLIEAMSFREGDHSTSDFSGNYRDEGIMKAFEAYRQALGNPIQRFEKYCLSKKWIEENTVELMAKEHRDDAKESLKYSKGQLKPSVKGLFEDTWHEMPKLQIEQYSELKDHLEKYKEEYDLESYAPSSN